jgi:hypothetical protein
MAAGIWISVWSFFKFLPFFFALLLLGIIKGEQNACSFSALSPFCVIEVWFGIVLEDGFIRFCPCFTNSIDQFMFCAAFASLLGGMDACTVFFLKTLDACTVAWLLL